jgi:tetratricopeptide (TPR) repeat protein
MKPFHTTIFLWMAGLPCAFGAPVTPSNAPAATTKPAAAAPQTAVAASKETASSQQAADSTPAQTAAKSKNADGSPAGAPSEPANKPAAPLKRALPKPRKIINNAKAVQEMEHYCKQHPRNWKGFYQLGCEYYKQDANAQAVEAYEKALKLCPWPEQQEPIFYNLGNALFYQAKALKNQRDQKIELLKKKLGELQQCPCVKQERQRYHPQH